MSKQQDRHDTNLLKFLKSIGQDQQKKICDFITNFQEKNIQNNKRPFSLYEDLLIILEFKEQEENLKKHRNLTIDRTVTKMSSLTGRAQTTIKQRMFNNIAKLSISQILKNIQKEQDLKFQDYRSKSKVKLLQQSRSKSKVEPLQKYRSKSKVKLLQQSRSKSKVKLLQQSRSNSQVEPLQQYRSKSKVKLFQQYRNSQVKPFKRSFKNNSSLRYQQQHISTQKIKFQLNNQNNITLMQKISQSMKNTRIHQIDLFKRQKQKRRNNFYQKIQRLKKDFEEKKKLIFSVKQDIDHKVKLLESPNNMDRQLMKQQSEMQNKKTQISIKKKKNTQMQHVNQELLNYSDQYQQNFRLNNQNCEQINKLYKDYIQQKIAQSQTIKNLSTKLKLEENQTQMNNIQKNILKILSSPLLLRAYFLKNQKEKLKQGDNQKQFLCKEINYLSLNQSRDFLILQLYPCWIQLIKQVSRSYAGYNELFFYKYAGNNQTLKQLLSHLCLQNNNKKKFLNKTLIIFHPILHPQKLNLIKKMFRQFIGLQNSVINIKDLTIEQNSQQKLTQINIFYDFMGNNQKKQFLIMTISKLQNLQNCLQTYKNCPVLLESQQIISLQQLKRYKRLSQLIRK